MLPGGFSPSTLGGGRRFWPIACLKIDIDGLAAARDQLWGEAVHRYHSGAKWWLETPDLNVAAAAEQRARYQPDPWDPIIAEYVASLSSITVRNILEQALHIPAKEQTQADANRVARSLKAMDWTRRQQRDGRDREWRYFKPAPVSQG